MPAAMPCKTPVNCRGETCCGIGKSKTKFSCFVDADESLRIRLEGIPQRHHEDHIAAKRKQIHWAIITWCTSLVQYLKHWKYPMAVEKGVEKLRQYRHGSWQVRNKTELIEEARNKGRKVHFALLMDLCHLKNSELEPQFQQYRGRVVLRGDTVKDDSGSYAVFTEQGSSASQMTAAKVMDIVSRLPGCAGQAADAVSAYSQVKMDDAPSLCKIPKSECPDIGIRLPKHKWPWSWSSMEDPVVCSSWMKYVRSSFGRTIVRKVIRESFFFFF